MAKLLISKRVIFKKGEQKKFLTKAKKATGLPWTGLAQLINISNRTLIDWKREKFSMSLPALKTLCRKTKIPLPKNIEIKNPYWYVRNGASAGGIAVYKKYGSVGGNPEYRKKRWREWWEKEGKYKKHPIINVALRIKKPRKSKMLAEFVGIIIGDGGISKRQLTVTLHSLDDKKYICFVIKLIKKLFGVTPSVYGDKQDLVNNIVVSRTELVRFCTEKLSMKIGNKIKQQIDIPEWIKKNKQFRIACMRGLVDTDGSIFAHRYKVNDKIYSYKKLGFTSHSKPLIRSVLKILREIGLHPRLSKNCKDVRIDSIEDMKNYFWIVGSHNQKHAKRYKS